MAESERPRIYTVLDNERMRAVALGDTGVALILQDAMNALAALMESDRGA
jgi:hypothetical protein